MPDRNQQPGGYGRMAPSQPEDGTPGRNALERIINALTFVSIIFFLALWITAFLLLRENLLAPSYSGNLLTDLTCITFFGGLVIAIFVGALVGNLLRRLLWKTLIRRGK